MHIQEIGSEKLALYAQVSIAFEVRSILEVRPLDAGWGAGSGGLALVEKQVAQPYIKDYDAEDDGEDRPSSWTRRFDLRNWGFLMACDGEEAVGGAAIAYATPEVYMLERRQDLAVLWDIRVRPERRGEGVGRALFDAAVSWARGRGCRQMKIETQNVNVPACRFYAAMGCTLGAVNMQAYAGHPGVGHEVMMLWYLDL